MVEQQTCEGEVWPVVASPEKKLKNFAIIFGFFRIFILPSVNLCRVLFRLCRVPDKKHSANSCLPTKRCCMLYAECYTRQSSCRVFLGHCRVPLALGETTVSRSGSWSPSPCTTIRLWWSFSRRRVTKWFDGDILLSLPYNTYSDSVGCLHHQRRWW